MNFVIRIIESYITEKSNQVWSLKNFLRNLDATVLTETLILILSGIKFFLTLSWNLVKVGVLLKRISFWKGNSSQFQ